MSKMLDLTGKRFGQLVALSRVGSDSRGQSMWLCKCSCGRRITVRLGNLRSGNTKSCGHDRGKRISAAKKANLAGKRFGRLVAIKEVSPSLHSIIWLCRCDCGNYHEASASNLTGGRTRSCGCFRREAVAEMQRKAHVTHGLTGTPQYDAARKNKRRERKKDLDSGWTIEMEQALRTFFPRCVVCGSGDRMSTDHVNPLSKGHGLHPGNAVRLCVHCNSVKQARNLDRLPDDMRNKIVEAALLFKDFWFSLSAASALQG